MKNKHFRIPAYNIRKVVTFADIQDGRHRYLEILKGRLIALKTDIRQKTPAQFSRFLLERKNKVSLADYFFYSVEFS